MKRFLIAVAIALPFFSSCSKEETPSFIVETDNPPEELFTGTYGVTNTYRLDKSSIDGKKNEGQFCICPPSGMPYECGIWYSIPARKLWGEMNGRIYVSKGIDYLPISPSAMLNAYEVINKRGVGKADYCPSWCYSPFGNGMIYNVQ